MANKKVSKKKDLKSIIESDFNPVKKQVSSDKQIIDDEIENLVNKTFYMYLKEHVFAEDLKKTELHKPIGSGRRRIYNSPAAFAKDIIKALAYLQRQRRVLTLSGCVEVMALSNEQALLFYEDYGEDYAEILNKLRTICKNYAYDLGLTTNSKFAQFLLQNYGLSTNSVITQVNKNYEINIEPKKPMKGLGPDEFPGGEDVSKFI